MSADAASLRCPHCGANVPPDAHRCKYCRGRLATVPCASCFALMFDGAAYCPACGARRIAPQVDAVPDKCPGCKKAMTRVTVGGAALLECGACDGVWLDAAEFERLCTQAEAQAAVLHHVAPRRTVKAAPVKYRPCLRCGTMMNRLNFGQISGTVVDVCRGHGTFLDAGELHAVVSFVQTGGLERARERRLEELKEQERRIDRKQSLAARKPADFRGRDVAYEGRWGLIDLLDLLRD
jgi:Zn-finger nucleic acid-binding protein